MSSNLFPDRNKLLKNNQTLYLFIFFLIPEWQNGSRIADNQTGKLGLSPSIEYKLLFVTDNPLKMHCQRVNEPQGLRLISARHCSFNHTEVKRNLCTWV